jgi:hypothetical protein
MPAYLTKVWPRLVALLEAAPVCHSQRSAGTGAHRERTARVNSKRPRPPVFVRLTGQADNIGDSVLRRPYAAALAEIGPLHAWVGTPGSGYEAGLDLPRGTVVYDSFLAWSRAFFTSVIRGRTVLALNAGEFNPTVRANVVAVLLMPAVLALRPRGGHLVWLGSAVPATPRGRTWPFRLLARHADIVLWRDAESAEAMRAGGTMPDWAFGLSAGGGWGAVPHSSTPTIRTRLAISLRGDRPYPSARWIGSVRSLADRLGLEPVVVVQVARDSATGRRLASDLGATLVDWESDKHSVQESAARGAYKDARVILADRLHSLIVAATEGALPIGATEAAGVKINRHFDLVGADWVGPGKRPAHEALDELDADRVDVLEAKWVPLLESARQDVHEAARSLSDLAARP